jgi:hypothetical protein
MNLSWLIRSSADPQKVSLAVKGAMLALMPIILYVSGITEANYSALTEAIVAGIFAISALISAIQIAFGILRKINFGRWSA